MTTLTSNGTLNLDELLPEGQRQVIIEACPYPLTFEGLSKSRDDSLAHRILDRMRGGLSTNRMGTSAQQDAESIKTAARVACPTCPDEVLTRLSPQKLATLVLHANRYNRH